MTMIDPQEKIRINHGEKVTVRIPLAGRATVEWLRCYRKLAKDSNVRTRAVGLADRAWIVVQIASSDNVRKTLDTAFSLIAEADTLADQSPAAAPVEAIIHEWWAGQGG